MAGSGMAGGLGEYAGCWSDHVCKGLFSSSEVPDTGSDQNEDFDHGENDSGPIKVRRSQEAPPKTIEDSDHRIEGVKEAKPFGDYAALKSNGRDVEAELNHKRDDKTEITILHHQGCNP